MKTAATCGAKLLQQNDWAVCQKQQYKTPVCLALSPNTKLKGIPATNKTVEIQLLDNLSTFFFFVFRTPKTI